MFDFYWKMMPLFFISIVRIFEVRIFDFLVFQQNA